MDNYFLIPFRTIDKVSITEVVECNEITFQYGLLLSYEDAQELIQTRKEVLKSTGRIEFSGGIIRKLIVEFCDSPFISQYNYCHILNELIEIFYYYKNETLEEISDDELILLMKKYFDQNCQGSIDLLQSRELETLARNIRYGVSNYLDLNEDTNYFWDEENYYE